MISVKNLVKTYRSPVKSGSFVRDFFSRKYKESQAVNHISFEVGENELVGFIGPNGAGKTTTMKILTGILYPTSGQVNVLGFTPFEKKPGFLKQIAFIMGQKNQMIWELPAEDSFRLNKEIYEIPDDNYEKNKQELVELLQAKEFVTQPIKTLSLGQRMRVELIASLLHTPKILFLDEPTIGLDIFAQTIITDFIKNYQEKFKATIMLTSHYMQDVERLAKRVVLIDHGKIIFDGKLSELVEKFSQEKTITITLMKPVTKKLQLPEHVEIQNNFPLLKVEVKRDELPDILPQLLKQVEFADLTIEDEPIEEVIKKTFQSTSSQNIK